ncbi:hypothetical protein BJ165DRAFT_1479593 [Panaeolus papilionaceus]|nr:hypothetical protein BJ165DRAFT_1479593 [Panaeolus papilionaceus]
MPTYKNIRIKGPISVVPITETENAPFSSVWILLLGQTGVGKSSFVQSLSQEGDLGIAKNTLESVTHEVIAYRLLNVTYNGAPISLIDTPGLSDIKISEMRIVKMIQKWMHTKNLSGINRMLYFDRITDIRMAGSKSRCTDIFKSLAGENAASAATLVTTMWDHVANEGMEKRVNDRYNQLQDDAYWKQFLDKGAGIVKFLNNPESALEILEDSLSRGGRVWFDFENMIQRNQNMRDTLLGKNLQRNVRERLELLQQRFRTIEDDLNHPSAESAELRTILVAHRKETVDSLEDANKDLEEFEQGDGENSDDPEISDAYTNDTDDDDTVDSRMSGVGNGRRRMRRFFRKLKRLCCCCS